MRREQRYDVVVIGAGTAGMSAAIRLAQRGAQVCVLAKGIGSTNLAPGTIDVLGYGPELVTDPGAGIDALIAARPDHPYALIGRQTVADAADWFLELAATSPQLGYRYVGEFQANCMLPTALGALKPSALVPETFAAGDARSLGRMLIVGLPGLRDFHPSLCAANLRQAGIDADFVTADIELERADMSTLGLARKFDDASWRAGFAGRLAGRLGGAERVGLPSMLGLRDPHGVLIDLHARLGRPVFEIATLPPSVPGMRLFEIFRHALRSAGGRLALGAEVTAYRRAADRIESVETASAGSPTTYSADAFVLAAGGVHSGQLNLDSSWLAHDTVFDLPVVGFPGPDQPRFVEDYFAEQPSARAGVAVGPGLRASGLENVFVAGAALPGAVSWREASGEGIALSSGYCVAEQISGTVRSGDRPSDRSGTAKEVVG